jgi:CheY-like chemotaxis protein
MPASTQYRPRVMIADNSQDIRDLLKFWLQQKGCRVVEAVDGDEAIKLARNDCPDLILMSLRLPVRSGLDATRCIREHVGECDVPILALSAYPTTDERTAAHAAGCTGFIAQPIDFDHLDNLFNHLCPAPTSH